MFPLLNCCVGAAVQRLGKLLVGLVPGGEALIEVVEFGADVWERWKKQKPAEAARREELQALAHASPERLEAAARAAIQAEAAGQPASVKRKLTTYLTQVQVAVRRTLCRPADPEGRTVPADLRLNSAEDLRPFLPPQLPRFEPGELKSPPAPVADRLPAAIPAAPARSPRDFDREGGRGVRRPPRRGVPGWVWLAGSSAAVVVVVVVVLVVRNGSGPKTPDGPPVAVKAPSDADKTKDADKAKDAEPDRKKDKKDKTDTPEKPAPLPRLVAFPKLSLPERGAADLQVKVDRQGYAGPIKLQVENLPPGVTCQRSATIPAGESALRLEVRTDGTAAEGTATVEVIATADARTADRQQLSLVVPPKKVPGEAKKSDPPLVKDLPLEPSFVKSSGMKFVCLPKGTFYLGGGGGEAGKKTEINEDFEIAIHTVTQGQWQALTDSNPSVFSRNGSSAQAVVDISEADLKQFPVENISWQMAQKFILKLNERERNRGYVYRLPTEAEWEYACRGGATSEEECSYHFYFAKPTNDLSSEEANFNGEFPEGKAPKGKHLIRPTKVGSYQPNKLGLYDMHGNVWQWCADLWAPGGSDRVVRGGSWDSRGDCCQAANRFRSAPTFRVSRVGLRLARVPRPVPGK